MFRNFVSLISKKNFLPSLFLLEILIIIWDSNKKNNLDFLLKNQVHFNHNRITTKKLEKILTHIQDFGSIAVKKVFFRDVLKLVLQKLIFSLLSSFSCDIKYETDFDYLIQGNFFYYIKLSENKMRFTGTILYLSVIFTNSKLNIKTQFEDKFKDFKKKIKKILSTHLINEISILGKILPYANESKLILSSGILYKTERVFSKYIASQKDISLRIKQYLKNISITQFDQKFVSENKWGVVFFLKYMTLGKICSQETLVSKIIQKKSLTNILKNKEHLALFNQFTYSLILALTFFDLKKRLNNFFNVFYFYQSFYLDFNLEQKNSYRLLNWFLPPNICYNLAIKIFGVIELKQKNETNLNWHMLLKCTSVLFFIMTKQRKIGSYFPNSMLKKTFFQFLNKFFYVFFGYSKILGKKTKNYWKNYREVLHIRILIFQNKTNKLASKDQDRNCFLQKSPCPIYIKLLKKDSIETFFYSHIMTFNSYLLSKFTNVVCLAQLLFFSKQRSLDSCILTFFNIQNTNCVVEILQTLFDQFTNKSYKKHSSFSRLHLSYKLSNRNLKFKCNIENINKLIFLNLITRTQAIPIICSLISKKIIENKNCFGNNYHMHLIKNPLLMSIYFSINFQLFKRRSMCDKGLSRYNTIKENMFSSSFICFMENLKSEVKKPISYFEQKTFSKFVALLQILRPNHSVFFKNIFSEWIGKDFTFFNKLTNFLKNQLNGSLFYILKTDGITTNNQLNFEKKINFLKKNVKRRSYNEFYLSKVFVHHVNKKFLELVIRIPYKTTMNKKIY